MQFAARCFRIQRATFDQSNDIAAARADGDDEDRRRICAVASSGADGRKKAPDLLGVCRIINKSHSGHPVCARVTSLILLFIRYGSVAL